MLQSQYDSYYLYGENKYGNPDAIKYSSCRAYENANDDGSYTYLKLGCSTTGGLKLFAYSDSSCTVEVTNNLGIYNDATVRFGAKFLISIHILYALPHPLTFIIYFFNFRLPSVHASLVFLPPPLTTTPPKPAFTMLDIVMSSQTMIPSFAPPFTTTVTHPLVADGAARDK